ncbi:SDR family NAD(P)-dependent oxidoreductase [Blastococcus sp. TF02A-26]|uniref:SDR family NAD(P)-dependent oxidoreductase n=1 Tax=Blastococcus sp. TF02A-26 TaxID=2250577 RepID=UPI000DE81A36|nr:SDR family oxidoreductase [Blastococcus sp. TF02A-26]RBY84359.1 short-chain dehydrogenase [Blastococcus sp. TF02A-26]
MTAPLAGRRAIVVGGGSGLGLAGARLLARDGATVTLAGRTAATLEAAREGLAGEGLEVGTVVCDAMDAGSVRAAVAAAADDEGALHIAVVVPGTARTSSVLLYGDDDFSADVDGNVRPVFLLLKYAGQAMLRAGGGSFVAISSTAAAFSARYLAGYSAGKAAVDQLVRVAADELGRYGVRVNSVRPGMTRTPSTARSFANEPLMAAFLAEQPIARHGEPDDVAAAIRYFAGPESSWTTGQLLAVDGGNTLRSFVDYEGLVPLADPRDVILGGGPA